MKNEHAGAIKGLSIAVVVLSAIGIIGAILIMVFSGLLSAVLLENGPEIAYHLEFNDNGTITGGGTAFDSEDAFFLSMLMMLVGGGVAIWALICCIVALIAGIFGIMHAANPPQARVRHGLGYCRCRYKFSGCRSNHHGPAHHRRGFRQRRQACISLRDDCGSFPATTRASHLVGEARGRGS